MSKILQSAFTLCLFLSSSCLLAAQQNTDIFQLTQSVIFDEDQAALQRLTQLSEKSALASYLVGYLHLQGLGTPISLEKAYDFFLNALQKGEVRALRAISEVFQQLEDRQGRYNWLKLYEKYAQPQGEEANWLKSEMASLQRNLSKLALQLADSEYEMLDKLVVDFVDGAGVKEVIPSLDEKQIQGYRSPKYPNEMRVFNTQGWVEVLYQAGAEPLLIIASSGQGEFENAVRRAAADWRSSDKKAAVRRFYFIP